MRRIIAIAVGVWCAVFFVKPLMAQVNIERLRPSLGPGVMSQSLRFGVTYLTGNSDSLEIQPVYRLDYSESGWSAFVIGDVHYGNRNGINFVNQTFFHGRIMVPVTDYATLEVFVQKERDDFRRMRDRQLFGGNYRLALLNSPYLQVAAALGVMLENENNTIEGESCLFRLNSYGTGHFSLANFNGTTTLYFQPALSDFSNFRLLMDNSATAMIGESNVGLMMSLKVTYDHNPPETVKPLDISLTSGLELKF